MKALCINSGKLINHNGESNISHELKEGKVYNVKQSYICEDSFSVEGLSFDYGGALFAHYLKKRFIPLSEIDETELVKERLVETNQ